jgi:protein-disulfide isomerase
MTLYAANAVANRPQRHRQASGFFRAVTALALTAAVSLGLATLTPLHAAGKAKSSFSDEQKAEIGIIVRDYLLSHPEVLVEVSQELEKRRKADEEAARSKVLISQKEGIFRSPHDFVLGDKNAKITIVEFFDYNCGWCKRALGEITKLMAKDPSVRFVMKEYPIFGENSAFAAKAALASQKQGKYWEFHQALMKQRQVTKENTLEVAKSVGIDVATLKLEMENPLYDQVLAENTQIAHGLGMQGTPGFIVDSKVNYGYLPAAELSALVAEIRKEGCKIC